MNGTSGPGIGYQYGGAAFPGGILLGIGILTGDFWGWLFVGFGLAFVLMAFIAAIARR
jgi:hypothetical protein